MLEVKQDSFSGGLNQQIHPTKIADNEYSLLINGRVRDDSIEPIKAPTEITNLLPPGKKQGIYVAGNILIAFIAGKGYYKPADIDGFLPILNLQLDATVDYIHFSLVPASTINFKRSLEEENPKSELVLGAHVTPSPSCALVQDGINQPWIILPNATARITQTYEQWQNNGIREYVPIGLFPMWNGKIQYMIGKDVTLNNILRSATGRPLDFMVNIQQDGNKQSVKSEGDAYTASYRVDYDITTALTKSSAVNGGFIVSTINNSYIVSEDLSDPIWGEPTFKRQFLFGTGPLNNFSTIDSLGDTLMITPTGIISFNAVLQTSNEGSNLPFSKKVRRLFTNIRQSITCAGKLDNYVFLCVNTVFGAGILVWDEITEVFVSLDQPFSSVNEFVKQIATITTNTISKIYCITNLDKVYELYSATETKLCSVYLGEWMGPNNKSNIKCLEVTLKVAQIKSEGVLNVSVIADQILVDSQQIALPINYVEPVSPISNLPFGSIDESSTLPLTFSFADSKSGTNIGLFVTFDSNCTLLSVQAKFEEQERVVSLEQEALQQTQQY